MRATGDLDIYIGEKDYEKGKQACQTLGCKEYEKETKKHIGYKFGETEIEIHRFVEPLMHPGHHRYYQKLSQEQLATPRTVSLGGVSFPIPPASFNALQCFMHLWHHFCQGGIGLRQLVDFAFILYQDYNQIDASALQSHLKKLGRLQVWQIIGCLVVDLLGLPSECYPLYSPKYRRNAELLLRLILHEGNFGKKKREAYTGTTRIQHKAYALQSWMSRSLTTCRIYPPMIGENA